MVCANLREISRSLLRESSRLRIFVREVNAKQELFSWAETNRVKSDKEMCLKLVTND